MANSTGKGGFKKGAPSPNPGGRPKQDADFVAACRAQCPAALALLISIMNDELADRSDRMRAANVIIERGYGKPHQAVELTGAEGESLIPSITVNIRKSDL